MTIIITYKFLKFKSSQLVLLKIFEIGYLKFLSLHREYSIPYGDSYAPFCLDYLPNKEKKMFTYNFTNWYKTYQEALEAAPHELRNKIEWVSASGVLS